jgi:ribonuclease HI
VGGRWHFVLERIDAAERLEATDGERAQPRERLALLAVVRGLEALEQPSQVTLVTTSRYVSRGLRYGLSEWREANYSWEHFGVQKPIRNADLWQRIDCAMQYHEVACRLLESSLARSEESTETVPELALASTDVALPDSIVPAPHFPVRAAASVRHVPRGNVAASRSAWWQTATEWLHNWRGRAGQSSLVAGL